jgi:hypothetical protein
MGITDNLKTYLYVNEKSKEEIIVRAQTIKQAQEKLRFKLYKTNKEMRVDFFDWKLKSSQG